MNPRGGGGEGEGGRCSAYKAGREARLPTYAPALPATRATRAAAEAIADHRDDDHYDLHPDLAGPVRYTARGGYAGEPAEEKAAGQRGE